MDNTPKRIQRKRVKGWKMPENTVYVGRPSKWGNPFTENTLATRQDAIDNFELFHCDSEFREEIKRELKGKNLACWCPLNKTCHADVLLKIANS